MANPPAQPATPGKIAQYQAPAALINRTGTALLYPPTTPFELALTYTILP